jgi:hypothetical protein
MVNAWERIASSRFLELGPALGIHEAIAVERSLRSASWRARALIVLQGVLADGAQL